MGIHADIERFDLQKFTESLVKAGREGVKWERKKLEWILEEEKKQNQLKSDAACVVLSSRWSDPGWAQTLSLLSSG